MLLTRRRIGIDYYIKRLNMIVFTGALIWIAVLYIINNRGIVDFSEEYKVTQLQSFIAMSYLVFFLGLRSGGADSFAYIEQYMKLEPGIRRVVTLLFNFHEPENFFLAFGTFMKSLFGDNYTPYLFSITALSGYSIARFFRKYSVSFYTSMILFMFLGYWTWMYNGIRQFWAASILYLCFDALVKGNLFLYVLGILIASRLHTSALIMIPVYFLVRSEPWTRRSLIPILVAAFALFLNVPFMHVLESIAIETEYGSILNNYYFMSDSGSNPIRTILYAIPTALAFINRDIIEREAPLFIKICVNMSLICVCVSAVANVTSGIYIGRLPIYFSLYNLVLYPWLFCHIETKDQRIVIPSITLLFLIYFVYINYYYSNITYYSDILGLTFK